MRKITSALALVGALGLFTACGQAEKSDGAAPEGPAAPAATETVDVVTPAPAAVVDAVKDIEENAGEVAGDMDAAALQTVELDIAGMT